MTKEMYLSLNTKPSRRQFQSFIKPSLICKNDYIDERLYDIINTQNRLDSHLHFP